MVYVDTHFPETAAEFRTTSQKPLDAQEPTNSDGMAQLLIKKLTGAPPEQARRLEGQAPRGDQERRLQDFIDKAKK